MQRHIAQNTNTINIEASVFVKIKKIDENYNLVNKLCSKT